MQSELKSILTAIEPNASCLTRSPDFRYFQMSWRFEDANRMVFMNLDTSCAIEREYFSGKANFTFEQGPWHYFIDFVSMTQENTDTGTIRKIDRVPFFSVFRKVDDNADNSINLENFWVEIENIEDDQKCSLCLENFKNFENIAGRLKFCKGHYFHKRCPGGLSIIDYLESSNHKPCPVCKTEYGSLTKNDDFEQMSGKMFLIKQVGSLPGYQAEFFWKMKFVVKDGINAEGYYLGTTQVAYLPDTIEGRKVLILFVKAWRSRKLFIVRNGVTTFGGISMKTNPSYGTFGFPDPSYLSRVATQFREHGIY